MNLTFAKPHFFWLLAIIPVLIGLKVLLDLRARELLKRAVAARLMPKLVSPRSVWRSWTALGLEIMAIACLVVTLARPQMGFVEEEIFTSGRSIMLAVDTSRSMLATDLEPDRITRTKLVISDLIAKLKADRIGLIAFAGKPFLQAPITQDHDALLETLDQFDTDIIPRGGSNLAEAIDLAVESFKSRNLPPGKTFEMLSKEEKLLIERTQSTSLALIIFSDGEELEGTAIAAAKRAHESNVTIITVGVGTKSGGVLPNPETGGRDYIRDEQGKIVKSVLKQEVLEEIARETKGLYLPLSEVIQDRRLDLILSKLDSGSNKNKTLKKAVERYQWPLAASLLFFLAAVLVRVIRRQPPALHSMSMAYPRAVVLTLLVGCLLIQPAPAASLGEQKDAKLVKHDPTKYEKSLKEFETKRIGGQDHLAWRRLGQGAIDYAQGEYDEAVNHFGKALLGSDPDLQTQAHFNLANTLFQRARVSAGQIKKVDPAALGDLIKTLKDSIVHYDETIKLKKEHAEAASNKKTVEDFIQKLQLEKEKQEGQQQAEKNKPKEKKEGEEESPGEGEGKSEGEGKESKDGKESKEKGEKEGKEKGDQPGEKGENDQSGQDGKGKDEKDKKAGEDKRTEEQKQAEKEANEASNQERKGKIEPMNQGKPGEKPGEAEGKNKEGEQQKDPRTGFSRSEARRNLNRFSDDVQVRPEQEQARPDRAFKNW